MHFAKNKEYKMDIEFLDFNGIEPNNRDKVFKFTGKDLIYSIATCGIINPLSKFSKEFKYKKYALECQFREEQSELYLSKEYDLFDPSEKKCLSYYRGMILGRLIAYKRFDLDYFVHLSNFQKRNSIVKSKISKGNSEPDIVGWNNKKANEYYVWECKGYRKGLKKGKDQAKTIGIINSKNVQTHIVSAVYPTQRTERIRACVKDPEIKGRKIEVNIDKGLESYYKPIINILKSSDNYSKSGMQLGKIVIDEEKYTIGVPVGIFDFFDKNLEKTLDNNEISLKQIISEYSMSQFKDNENMYNDFIYIK